LTVAAVNGVATFSDLTVDKVGPGYTLTATAPSLTSATSAAFNITQGGVSMAQSLVTVSSGTVASGSTVTLVLQAKDAAGNNLTTSGLTVVFSASGGTSLGTISPNTATDNGNGTYTGTFMAILAGTATTIGATINRTAVTSTLPTVTVTPGAAVSLVGRPALTILGPSASGAITLIARDAVGNLGSTAAATLNSLSPAVAQTTGLTVTGAADGIAQLEASLGWLRDTIAVIVAGTGRFIGTLGAPNRDTSVATQSTLHLDFALDATRAAPLTLGSFTVTVGADPQVVRLDSVAIAGVQNLAVNLTRASSGSIVVGGFTPTGVPANAVLFRLWVTVVGQSGQRTRITVTPQDLTETATLVDLRPATSIADARVRVQ
jgi:hypothetical protein